MSTARKHPVPASTMTYEEFLDWADEDTLAEWVDGKVEMASPANAKHRLLTHFLSTVHSVYVRFEQLGVVIPAPFQMKLPRSGREPDVIFLAQAHRDRLKDTYLDGPADLAVEVISPDSATRDRAKKFAEYQQGGVAEYWLLDPDTQGAEFYQLDARGTYQRVLPDARGIYHSQAVPGFWLNVAWLWQSPEPTVDQVLQEIAGEAYARHLAAHADEAFARALLAQLREQGKLPDTDP